MKKDQQVVMNDYVLENTTKMRKEFEREKFPQFDKKLRSCQAFVCETENYFILKSYRTVVAFIDKVTGQKFDVLRLVYGYTATSSQHISKFFADYGDFRDSTYTYREV